MRVDVVAEGRSSLRVASLAVGAKNPGLAEFRRKNGMSGAPTAGEHVDSIRGKKKKKSKRKTLQTVDEDVFESPASKIIENKKCAALSPARSTSSGAQRGDHVQRGNKKKSASKANKKRSDEDYFKKKYGAWVAPEL